MNDGPTKSADDVLKASFPDTYEDVPRPELPGSLEGLLRARQTLEAARLALRPIPVRLAVRAWRWVRRTLRDLTPAGHRS